MKYPHLKDVTRGLDENPPEAERASFGASSAAQEQISMFPGHVSTGTTSNQEPGARAEAYGASSGCLTHGVPSILTPPPMSAAVPVPDDVAAQIRAELCIPTLVGGGPSGGTWFQGSGNFPCSICGMKFRSAQALGGHQNGHKEVKGQSPNSRKRGGQTQKQKGGQGGSNVGEKRHDGPQKEKKTRLVDTPASTLGGGGNEDSAGTTSNPIRNSENDSDFKSGSLSAGTWTSVSISGAQAEEGALGPSIFRPQVQSPAQRPPPAEQQAEGYSTVSQAAGTLPAKKQENSNIDLDLHL